MAIEHDFLELMPFTIQIRPMIDRDDYSKPIYGDPTSYRASIIKSPKNVMSNEGNEVTSNTQVYIFGAPDISPEDQLILHDGTKPKILLVAIQPDENGYHHTVIYCGGVS